MGVVGKSDFKENPKSDLDLDLGFVKSKFRLKFYLCLCFSDSKIFSSINWNIMYTVDGN